jgi:hypothetical protein
VDKMPEKSIDIVIDLARSPHVDLGVEEAVKLLKCIEEKAWSTRDLSETIRILNNFEEFYRYMRKKFEDYITPPKNSADSILGKVIVHKLRLYKTNETKRVEILFDRRFTVDIIIDCLKELGYTSINVVERTI